MQKTMQRILLKLGTVGCLAFLLLNFPLLSVYHDAWFGYPVLFVGIFGIWLGVVLIAARIVEGGLGVSNVRPKATKDR